MSKQAEWNERIEQDLKAIESLVKMAREEIAKIVSGHPDAEGCVLLEHLINIQSAADDAREIYEED